MRKYQEFTFKCEFEVKSDEFDSKIKEVFCQNYFEIKVENAGTKVSVGFHQRDLRIPEVGVCFPYMSIAIAVVKLVKGHTLEFYDIDEFDM